MIKYSKQRELILNCVRDNPVHPTANMVYDMLHADHPGISMGTVYRNLNLLAEQGQLLRIQVAGGGDRFDGTVTPHLHAVCEKCGTVCDFSYNLNSLSDEVTRQSGITPTDIQLYVKGICADCAVGKVG